LLLGCYRAGDANDPEIYIAAVVAVLAAYAPEVVRHVTDPRTGLPSQQTFLPSAAEVRKACDEHTSYLLRMEENRKFQALRDRNLLMLSGEVTPRPDGSDYYSMMAKHGRAIGLFEDPHDKWNRIPKPIPQSQAAE
jgi:hypothetical protein